MSIDHSDSSDDDTEQQPVIYVKVSAVLEKGTLQILK
jgi:hypothetical protein